VRRFRLPAVAILIGLFLPAVGVCASLTPPAAFASFCPAGDGGERSCCGDESGSSCPAPDRAPASPRCRACEGLLTFTGEERAPLHAPDVARPLPASCDAAALAAFAPAPHRLRSLSETPPLQLLHESFRN